MELGFFCGGSGVGTVALARGLSLVGAGGQVSGEEEERHVVSRRQM